MDSASIHPYYPVQLDLPHYLPSPYSMAKTLGIFSVALLIILSGAYTLAAKRHLATTKDRIIFLWFVMSGCIHLGLEGYYAFTHRTIAGDNTVLANLWKEYALSDSRYLSSDPFVLVMESVTAIFWGPGCLLVAYFLLTRHPALHPTQLIVSLGQIYGCVLYYFTTLFEGGPHCRPEPYYFYFYFVFFNIFWIVTPLYLLRQSFTEIVKALRLSSTHKTE
ncbi:Emopamil-binding protein [Piptocephalis cylindrospora]|uniref:Emopamil-binding protein n=1 Tax=Piptocephalis cylindrospora TaxID=1907219 RepID=A0A4P9XY23_9FUNG|nr:Emopamil-binding protein [Piptocephalis cylindrospora]|eukprot:RKP11257.1 Emopamil-binding protein [Piptocephalis cylindrospora]